MTSGFICRIFHGQKCSRHTYIYIHICMCTSRITFIALCAMTLWKVYLVHCCCLLFHCAKSKCKLSWIFVLIFSAHVAFSLLVHCILLASGRTLLLLLQSCCYLSPMTLRCLHAYILMYSPCKYGINNYRTPESFPEVFFYFFQRKHAHTYTLS